MHEWTTTCPHCLTQKVGLKSVGQDYIEYSISSEYSSHVWHHFLKCRSCGKAIVAVVRGGSESLGPHHVAQSEKISDFKFSMIDYYPKPPRISAPEHTPRNIASNYKEALDSLNRGNWVSAAVIFRKVLDRATKELDPSLKGRKLIDRIESLAQQGAISPAMKDWATIVRLEGNEAVHDEDPDEETAKELKEYTELFLTYSFTLTHRVKEHHNNSKATSKKK